MILSLLFAFLIVYYVSVSLPLSLLFVSFFVLLNECVIFVFFQFCFHFH